MEIILHNIRSAYNVGSCFRTADGAGVNKIYLTGYTPDPIDRFGRKRGDIAKVALGAEEGVPWEHFDSIEDLISSLKQEGKNVVAVEQNNASDYQTVDVGEKPVFIFGNEVEGIEESVLELADSIIEIPLHGMKKSLNVSVAVGIVLFKFL